VVSFAGDYGKGVNAQSGATVQPTRTDGKAVVTVPLAAETALVVEAQSR